MSVSVFIYFLFLNELFLSWHFLSVTHKQGNYIFVPLTTASGYEKYSVSVFLNNHGMDLAQIIKKRNVFLLCVLSNNQGACAWSWWLQMQELSSGVLLLTVSNTSGVSITFCSSYKQAVLHTPTCTHTDTNFHVLPLCCWFSPDSCVICSLLWHLWDLHSHLISR